MKILLLGSNGQVGWELQRSLSPLGDVIAPLRDDLDLCGNLADLAGLRTTVRKLAPQLVVNAAAYTAVDRAEADREAAQVINGEAVAVLAQEAQSMGAWMVHFSTDYVFDGSGDRPWAESDPPAPLNWYGASKLEGERRLQSCCTRHVLLRTSWVYAQRGNNFARTMLRLARERDELKVVADQFGAPTGAELIADVTAHVARAAMQDPALAGTYHLSAGGETSWHGYARHVLEVAGRAGATLRAGADQVRAITTADYPTPARRPLNSRLDCSRLKQTFGLHLPDWRAGVTRMIHETLSDR